MDTIDSFVQTPLLISAAAGLVLFILLLIAKIRKTAAISFVYFPVIGITVAGAIFTAFDPKVFYIAIILILCELLFIAYAFVLAVSDPEKIAEKKQKKEQQENYDPQIADTKALAAQAEKFKALLKTNQEMVEKASQYFKEEDSLASFLENFNKLIVEQTNADGCAILVFDEFDNILAVKSVSGTFPPPYKLPEDLPHKAIRVETNFRYSNFGLTGNIFGEIFSSGEAVNITNPIKDPRVYQNGPEDFLRCGPYIFIPVKQSGESTSIICLARKPDSEPFSKEEFETACNLANALSVALVPLNSFLAYAEHAELTKEGDIATKFQKTLVPEKIPAINKLSIGKYEIQTENVCGDYYDIIPSRKDRITFIMSDVAGKGMNSLVVMIMVRAMLRLLANTNQTAATILEWVNKAICSEKNSMDHFASVSLINYNSVNNTAQIASSGMNPVLLYSSQTGSITKVSTSCEPIGVEKNTQFKNVDISLDAGDILVTCTDGLLECLNESGVQYSLENLSKVIKANCKLNGKDIAAKVKDNIKKFCGNTQQYDDQSLLVIKIQG
ncbi:MAG: SpoIIE family protein phosphatase [Treponema sp.]|nr:SpoIIE family protein phosphatase [Treponema sp.]